MNKPAIALLICATAAAVVLHERAVCRNLIRASAELRQSLAAAQLDAVRLRQEAFEHQRTAENTTEKLSGAWSRLAAARKEALLAKTSVPEPASEGAWPAEKPYFHLAKHYLPAIGYTLFEAGGRVSETAATLFGLTAAERDDVENAARHYQATAADLLRNHSERIPTPPELDTDAHREIVFRVKAIGDDLSGARDEFQRSLEGSLGTERAALFYAKAESWLYTATGDASNGSELGEYRVKVEDQRQSDGSVRHTLWLGGADPNSGFFSGQGFSYPVDNSPAFGPYRSLFGSAPLLEDRKPAADSAQP